MTANELQASYNHNGNSGVYTTRLSELERKGCVYVQSKRKCKITGNTAISWDVSGRLPMKPEPRVTKSEKKKQILFNLTELWEISGNDENRDLFKALGEQIKNI